MKTAPKPKLTWLMKEFQLIDNMRMAIADYEKFHAEQSKKAKRPTNKNK